jgi:hypothetical protein
MIDGQHKSTWLGDHRHKRHPAMYMRPIAGKQVPGNKTTRAHLKFHHVRLAYQPHINIIFLLEKISN